MPQSAPERDPTIGPAYYNGQQMQQSQYKGVHFSKYSSKRTNFAGKSEGPGPGEYDTIEPIHVDVEHYHMKNNADKKPELNVPRYPEAFLKNVEKEVFCKKTTVSVIRFSSHKHKAVRKLGNVLQEYFQNKKKRIVLRILIG